MQPFIQERHLRSVRTMRPVGKRNFYWQIRGKAVTGEADEELAEYTSREIEAKMIASRACELTDPVHGQWIWDKEKECYRPAEYGIW